MYNNTNPAELYSGTTWELLTTGKYIQSGSTALQTGGSNSIAISKANLPNVKLKVDSTSATTQKHEHQLYVASEAGSGFNATSRYMVTANQTKSFEGLMQSPNRAYLGGGGNTGSFSPYTESLGSGTALTIQPSYITLKFWKRLT